MAHASRSSAARESAWAADAVSPFVSEGHLSSLRSRVRPNSYASSDSRRERSPTRLTDSRVGTAHETPNERPLGECGPASAPPSLPRVRRECSRTCRSLPLSPRGPPSSRGRWRGPRARRTPSPWRSARIAAGSRSPARPSPRRACTYDDRPNVRTSRRVAELGKTGFLARRRWVGRTALQFSSVSTPETVRVLAVFLQLLLSDA